MHWYKLSCPTVLGTCVEAHVNLNHLTQCEAVSTQETVGKLNSSPEPVRLQRLMATLPKNSPIGGFALDAQGTLQKIKV